MQLDQLKEWRRWGLNEKPTLVKEFSEGLNHRVYLLESSGEKYVLKQFTQPAKQAIEIQQLTSKHSISPQIIYADPSYVYQVMEYIVATESIEKKDLAVDNLSRILNELHNLYISDSQTFRFNLINYCDTYLEKIDDSKANRFHNKLLPILEDFQNDKTPYCLCHNDLVAENILFAKDNIQLIDWEYAQPNNPWFDLASTSFYLQLSEAQTIKLLEHYFESTFDTTPQILTKAKCAVLWLDILWRLAFEENQTWNTLANKRKILRKLSSS